MNWNLENQFCYIDKCQYIFFQEIQFSPIDKDELNFNLFKNSYIVEANGLLVIHLSFTFLDFFMLLQKKSAAHTFPYRFIILMFYQYKILHSSIYIFSLPQKLHIYDRYFKYYCLNRNNT